MLSRCIGPGAVAPDVSSFLFTRRCLCRHGHRLLSNRAKASRIDLSPRIIPAIPRVSTLVSLMPPDRIHPEPFTMAGSHLSGTCSDTGVRLARDRSAGRLACRRRDIGGDLGCVRRPSFARLRQKVLACCWRRRSMDALFPVKIADDLVLPDIFGVLSRFPVQYSASPFRNRHEGPPVFAAAVNHADCR